MKLDRLSTSYGWPTSPTSGCASEFVYLAVVLDAFSRKVVGWALDRTLTTRLPLLALQRAITLRQPCAWPGASLRSRHPVRLRAVHGACCDIHGILPSMSRPGNPYDNAFCESFIKTLKREQIDAHKYHVHRPI